MEELITASRGRRRAVIAPSRDGNGNDDHHSADADPVARANRRAIDLVKSMSYDERVIYVTDLLNTQVSRC